MLKSSLLHNVGILIKKELQMEMRSKSGLMSFLQFSFISLFLVSISMNAVASSMSLELLVALFWVILFFTSLATLDKAFTREKERGTLLALQLYVPSQAVFIGKFFYNFLMVFSMSILLGIAFIILMDVTISYIGPSLLVFFLGDIGIAAAGTLLGALVSFSHNDNYLFAIISFPIFLPIFLLLIQVTTIALTSPDYSFQTYGLIVAYDVIVLAASSILFDYLWYE